MTRIKVLLGLENLKKIFIIKIVLLQQQLNVKIKIKHNLNNVKLRNNNFFFHLDYAGHRMRIQVTIYFFYLL